MTDPLSVLTDTLDRLQQASTEDLMAVKGIGPKTAATILAAIQDLLARPALGADHPVAGPAEVAVDEKAAQPESE
ncbi:MAG: helix-hairpin-helix domain-containing protein [candidate division NC10 bacterium]|nr:helix-hairpin-helix domain-containing protein [candidate division NC10 bacterium]